MSSGLAPSKSTIYVSNLPFSLTNNDMHKIFEKYGTVVKVTILRDEKHRSKGVAFILYLEKEAARKAVQDLHNSQMFERTIRCSIAKDNGRAADFIRKKVYKDKTKCYECGDDGHLSYNCPKNLLGDRPVPEKKKKKKAESDYQELYGDEDRDGSDEDPVNDSLSAAIQIQHQKMSEESLTYLASCSSYEDGEPKKKKYKKDTYFSDEEELGGDD